MIKPITIYATTLVSTFLATASWSGAPYSDSDDVPIASFAKLFDRPLRIAIYQPPRGLVEELYRLDETNGIIDRDAFWVPFLQADVLVYLVAGWENIDQLGSFPMEIFEKAEPRSKTAVLRLDISAPDDRKQMKFIDMTIFEETPRDQIVCLVATYIYSDLKGGVHGDWRQAAERCRAG